MAITVDGTTDLSAHAHGALTAASL